MMKMKQKFTASIWQEDEWVVAQCIEIDVASQGKTENEAPDNLRDALELHFAPPVAFVLLQNRSVETDFCRPRSGRIQ
jgi:predicted RNase H-like HicB family nuclease